MATWEEVKRQRKKQGTNFSSAEQQPRESQPTGKTWEQVKKERSFKTVPIQQQKAAQQTQQQPEKKGSLLESITGGLSRKNDSRANEAPQASSAKKPVQASNPETVPSGVTKSDLKSARRAYANTKNSFVDPDTVYDDADTIREKYAQGQQAKATLRNVEKGYKQTQAEAFDARQADARAKYETESAQQYDPANFDSSAVKEDVLQFGTNPKTLAKYLGDENYRASYNKNSERDAYKKYDELLTDEEKKTVLYYASQGDYDSVKGYIKSLDRDINERGAAYEKQQINDMAESGVPGAVNAGVLSTMAGFVSPLSYAETAKQAAKNMVTGNDDPVDVNSSGMVGSRTRENSNQAIMDQINSPVAQFLTSTGLSMVDFATKLPFGPQGALAYMTGEAAGDSAYDYANRGASAGQALAGGTLAGAAAYTAENILPIDRLFEAAKGGVNIFSKAGLKSVLNSAMQEGLEEPAEDYLNMLADAIVMGNDSEFNTYKQQLIASGMDESSAHSDALMKFLVEDPALSFLGGAISGGAFMAGAQGVGTYRVGQMFNDAGDTNALVVEGMDSSPETESFKVAMQSAQKLADGGKLSANEKAALYYANVDAIEGERLESQKNSIKNFFASNQQQADDHLVDVVSKAFNGDPLSNTEAEAIINNYAARFLFEQQTGSQITGSTLSQMRKSVKQFSDDVVMGKKSPVDFSYAEAQQEAPEIGFDADAQTASTKPETMKQAAQPRAYAAKTIENDFAAVIPENEAQKYGEKGRRALSANISENASPLAYRAFETYYRAGTIAAPASAIDASFDKYLSAPARFAAYNSGVNDSNANKPAQAKAVVHRDAAASALNLKNVNREERRFIENIGKALGTSLRVMPESDISNGYYNRAKGEIVLFENSNNPLGVVMAHETAHRMAELAPKEFNALAQHIIGKVADDYIVNRYADKYKAVNPDVSYGDILEEIVADYTMNNLDQAAAADICAENPSIGKKIVRVIKDIIERVKAALKGPEQAKALKSLREFQKLWENALDASRSAVAANNGTEAEAEAAPLKFSLKNSPEQTKNLIAVHNLTESKLRKTLKLSGFPMPSIAISRADQGHSDFGDISLVFDKNTIDPKNKKNKVFSADAWTPVVPRIDYEADSSIIQNARVKAKKLVEIANPRFTSSADNAIYGAEDALSSRDGFDGYVDYLTDNAGIKAAYLGSKGITVQDEIEERDPGYKENAVPLYDKLKNDVFDGDMSVIDGANGKEVLTQYGDKIRDIVAQHIANSDESSTPYAEKLDFAKSIVSKFANFQLWGEVKAAKNYFKTLEPGYQKDFIISDSLTERKMDSLITDKNDFRRFAENLVDGIVKNSGVYNGKDPFTPSGNRKSFSQLHYELTAENIVKAMLTKGMVDTSTFNGIGTLRAAVTKQYKSIAEIKKDTGRLNRISPEDLDARNEEFRNRLSSIMSDIMETKSNVKNDNRFIAMDYLGTAIQMAANDDFSPDKLKSGMALDGYVITEKQAEDLSMLISDIQSAEVSLFEAKPQRVVAFDEIKKAVVPESTSEDLLDKLRDIGVPVVTYKDGDDAARIEALNDDSLKFSLKSTKDLLTENQRLRDMNEALKRELKTTDFRGVDEKKTRALVNRYLKEYSSKADAGEIYNAVKSLYDFMQSENATGDEILARAKEVADSIIVSASAKNDSLYTEYAGLRGYLHNTGISISESDRSSIADFESWRKNSMGKVKIKKDGLPVDVAYTELSEMYPEFFDPEITHPADQLTRMVDVFDSLKPTYENPFADYAEDAAVYLAYNIYDDYFDVPQQKRTFADRQNKKLLEMRLKNDEKLRIIKETAKAQRVDQIKKLKEKYKQQSKDRTANAKRSDRVASITKMYKDMQQRMMKPSDQKHIPQALRPAVAKFLEAFDFSTTRQKAENVQAMAALRSYFAREAGNDAGVDLASESQVIGDIIDNIDSLIATMPQKPIKKQKKGDVAGFDFMSNEEIELTYQIMCSVRKMVQNYDKLLTDGRNQTITQFGEEMILEHFKPGDTNSTLAIEKAKDFFNFDLANAYTFAETMGGTYKELFDGLDKGYNKLIENIGTAKDYISKARERCGITPKVMDNMSGEKAKVYDFTVSNGQTIKLTKAQIMFLYLSSKREQAMKHILSGGISPMPIVTKLRQDKGGNTKKTVLKHKITQSTPVKMQIEDVNNIISTLSDKELEFADTVSAFLNSTTSAWGNEVTMALHGYKKFTESNYISILSDKNFVDTSFGTVYEASLTGKSWTKATTEKANNAIYIDDIFSYFAGFTNEMAIYNALTLPLYDMKRVMNYKSRDASSPNYGKSVAQSVQSHFGPGAMRFFKQLMIDANGGMQKEVASNFGRKLLALNKAAAIGFSISSTVQQPTAVFRAMAFIDPKYVLKGFAKRGNFEAVAEKSTIAKWKSFGYFGNDIGQPVTDLIIGKDRANEVFFKPMEAADNFTWARLWNAVEYEILDTMPELKRGTPEFEVAVAARFDYIIKNSQVIDTVLKRTQIMRSNADFNRIYTSFMGEPLENINMLHRAVNRVRTEKSSHARAFMARTVSTILLSQTAAAVAKALAQTITGRREDDDFLQKIADNMKDDITGMIPYVSDLFEVLITGEAPSDLVWQGVVNLSKALKASVEIFNPNSKKSVLENIKTMSAASGMAFGVPTNNIIGQLSGFARFIGKTMFGPMGEYEALKTTLNVRNSENHSKFVDVLFSAWESGDKDAMRKVRDDLIKNGVSKEYLEKSFRTKMLNHLQKQDDVKSIAKDIAGWKSLPESEKTPEKKSEINQKIKEVEEKYKNSGYGADVIQSAIKSAAKKAAK